MSFHLSLTRQDLQETTDHSCHQPGLAGPWLFLLHVYPFWFVCLSPDLTFTENPPRQLSYSIQTAVTEFHRLGGLETTEICQSSRGWEVQDQAASRSDGSLLTTASHGRRDERSLWGSSKRGTIPTHEGPTSISKTIILWVRFQHA